jgi:glycosyltransferase involved in cell wall biosynthesis
LFDNPPGTASEERILFFGDWRKVKGLGVLMEAFDELATRRPTARLTIAGTPSDADYNSAVVRDWARRHGDRVEVIDRYVPLEEVPDVFGRARVVANPYLVGFQSAVVHLAMSMGRAVVASDVGDLPDAVLHGQTGRVVPPGDASALANALEYVIADPDVAASYGRAGREHAERHGRWEDVADAVVDAMREARRRDGF